MVYMKLQDNVLPSQSVYVHVYVRIPVQTIGLGLLVTTGPVGVSVSPQLLITTGGVGCVAKAGELTVAEPLVGTVNGLRSMV